ncbi:Prolyl 3-hydroxylase OGFOD1 [Geodia barretti]|uniref:Prolyl 3-hydroxylase OGFOD1 n=1 Tax=Geodia barretti TaxID=519541 RepID=A0AA35QZ11_GEOBA|nr:Prolyl 3-hydroxylase OGFOD1 [Geodia barretti]
MICNYLKKTLSTVAVCVVLWALCRSSAPNTRRSAATANCSTNYQPASAAVQLANGFEVAEHFTKAVSAPGNMTFYTTLVSLSQIAIRLDNAVGLLNSPNTSSSTSTHTCKNSNSSSSNSSSNATSSSSSSSSLELRALSAVVSQVVKDACNYVLEISTVDHQVNCEDLNEVATWSLHLYNSPRSQSQRRDSLTIAEAYSVHRLLPGIFPDGTTADPGLVKQWSDDLKRFKSPCITAFRDVLREQVLPWLGQVTGIQLTTQIDITCSKYEFTDYLLCHDDRLEGRRIAFVFYLVQDWTPLDGGHLELFYTDENGHPHEVTVSIPPVWNNFVFFEVTPAPLHQ